MTPFAWIVGGRREGDPPRRRMRFQRMQQGTRSNPRACPQRDQHDVEIEVYPGSSLTVEHDASSVSPDPRRKAGVRSGHRMRSMFTMKDVASLHLCWLWRRRCATHEPSRRVAAAVCASKPQATGRADHHVVVAHQQAADPLPQFPPRLIRHHQRRRQSARRACTEQTSDFRHACGDRRASAGGYKFQNATSDCIVNRSRRLQ
jgi:hypothetical protein